MKRSLTMIAGGVAITVVLVLVLAGYGGMEYYTSRSSFCGGTCHIMSEQYEGWKKDRHHAANNPDGKQAECIDCHFLPGGKYTFKAKMEGLRHLAAYLYDPKAPLPIRPVVPDGACLRGGCHDVTKFQDKQLEFTERKVKFKHAVHFSGKALDGQKLSCDTCHVKVTAEKHFEVPAGICFLCHLKSGTATSAATTPGATGDLLLPAGYTRAAFTEAPTINFTAGVSKCALCHTIPAKSLQSQASKDDPKVTPITHQTIEKAGVACAGCHFAIAAGNGQVDKGNVNSSGCLACHNRSETLLAKAGDLKLMHDAHVAAQRADCFDCHREITHRDRTDHLDALREECGLCHQGAHAAQKVLLAGVPVVDGVRAVPNLMFKVNTNCRGCHLDTSLRKRHTVKTGTAKACVGCHSPEHEKMLEDWRKTVEKEVKAIEAIEANAVKALAEAAGKIDASKISEAEAKIAAGRAMLDVIRIGNGVHNKKYSITIIDEVYPKFEDAIDLLGGGK